MLIARRTRWLLFLTICEWCVCREVAGKNTRLMRYGVSDLDSRGFGNKAVESDSPKILFYSNWTPWSRCNERCERTRHRRCLNQRKCGNIVLKETDACGTARGDARNRRRCQRRKHRHKGAAFQVVRPPGVATSVNVRRASRQRLASAASGRWGRFYPATSAYPFAYPVAYPAGWAGHLPAPTPTPTPTSHRESSVIFPSFGHTAAAAASPARRPDADRTSTYESQLYGKWTRWSQCTRACTTHRRRNCKRKDLCGNTMLKESAYCYVEDSYCQRWIQRKLQKRGEDNEAIQDFKYPPAGYNAPSKATSVPSASASASRLGYAEKDDAGGDCGVAGNTSRSLGNMLRIIGGRPTAKGRWPWQVAVLNRYREAFCGGTLVSTRWVLTAAHCLRKRLYVRIGDHDLSEQDGTETELRIEQMVRHPSYDEETVDNDVALLRLPVAVATSPSGAASVGVACLPRSRQPLPTDRYCTIIGWGKRVSSDTFGTDVLHEAEVPIVSNEVCRHVYEDYHITGNMFCAGYRRGRMDSCAGDSGGPLLCREGGRWTVFGITSFGEGCGKHGKYGIYTRLPNYVKWVQKTIKD